MVIRIGRLGRAVGSLPWKTPGQSPFDGVVTSSPVSGPSCGESSPKDSRTEPLDGDVTSSPVSGPRYDYPVWRLLGAASRDVIYLWQVAVEVLGLLWRRSFPKILGARICVMMTLRLCPFRAQA